MLSIVFAGTSDFAVPALKLLHDSEHKLLGVYTMPDRAAGRGQKITKSPVKQFAESHDLPIFQSAKFVSEDLENLKKLKPDLIIVAAYGLILPEAVLTIPKYGCLNIHGSLLPRWRGAAPIHRAILADDKTTGISIMQMDKGLDTGEVLKSIAYKITPNITTGELHDQLAILGANSLLEVLNNLAHYQSHKITQDNQLATYADKISKQEAQIDWTESAEIIARKIRAYNPYPIAYSFLGEQRVKFFQARVSAEDFIGDPGEIISIQANLITVATGKDILILETLQFPGGKILSAQQCSQKLSQGMKFI